MQLKVFSLTDKGKVRSHNEDCFGYNEKTPNGKVYVVCDGMGGHVGGGTASKLAVNSILEYFGKEKYDNLTIEIDKAFQFANEQIYAHTLSEPQLRGMGTTAVVLIVRDQECFIGHVGDSRIYIKSDGQLHRITKDHSFVQSLVDSGAISDDEAERHPKKNQILKALGHSSEIKGTVCERPFRVKAGDTFMLCSDGLNGMIQDAVISGMINSSDLEKSAHDLLNAAMANGGLDNITVLLVHVEGSTYYGPNEFRSFNPVAQYGKKGADDPNNKTQGLSQTQKISGDNREALRPGLKKRPQSLYLIIVSAALLLLLSGIGAYLLFPGKKEKETTPVSGGKKYSIADIKKLNHAQLPGTSVESSLQDGVEVECADGRVKLEIKEGQIVGYSEVIPPPPPNPPVSSNPDRDGDGIPDDRDKCPDEKGEKKYGGCATKNDPAKAPTKDQDGDGIPDDRDKCPDEKGEKKYGGCATKNDPAKAPTKDKDGDGVSDDNDKCLDVKGSLNNNGCPEKVSIPVTKNETFKMFFERVKSMYPNCKIDKPTLLKACGLRNEMDAITKTSVSVKIECNR